MLSPHWTHSDELQATNCHQIHCGCEGTAPPIDQKQSQVLYITSIVCVTQTPPLGQEVLLEYRLAEGQQTSKIVMTGDLQGL